MANLDIRVEWDPIIGKFYAIDRESYDGAPDSETRNQVGYGTSREEAVRKLEAIIHGS